MKKFWKKYWKGTRLAFGENEINIATFSEDQDAIYFAANVNWCIAGIILLLAALAPFIILEF